MAGYTKPDVPAPTPEQQRVLVRIAQQRERIRVRPAAGANPTALAPSQNQVIPAAAPFATRAVSLAARYPLLVAALAVAALVAGPRRLVRWADVVMPVFNRLRPLLARHG